MTVWGGAAPTPDWLPKHPGINDRMSVWNGPRQKRRPSELVLAALQKKAHAVIWKHVLILNRDEG